MKEYILLLTGLALIGNGMDAMSDTPGMEILDHNTDSVPQVAGVRAVTQGPKHHFFGYYGMFPWDATGRYLVCLESEFGEGEVDEGRTAALCLVDLESGELKKIGETSAWNFQQGCLVHWLGTAPDRKIIHNDRVDGKLCSVILDVHSGEQRVLPRPIAGVAHNGKTAASISYARLATTRPGYGYTGAVDLYADELHPKEDGLYVMDLETGESTLIVSMDQVFHAEPVPAKYIDDPMWFNHVIYNRGDTRIFFLARYRDKGGWLVSAAFTVNLDGSDLRCIIPYEWGASHFDWLDSAQVLVTTRYQEGKDWLHVLVDDRTKEYEVLAPELLDRDGHGHFSPDGKWMVTDSYPQGLERMRSLYLMNMKTREVATVARFHEPKNFRGSWRCDLHPRWSRDSKQICIDSTHDGTRQVYIVNLGFPVARSE